MTAKLDAPDTNNNAKLAETLQLRLDALEEKGLKHFNPFAQAQLQHLLSKSLLLSKHAKQQLLEKTEAQIGVVEHAFDTKKKHAEQSLQRLLAMPHSGDTQTVQLLLHEKKYHAAELLAQQLMLECANKEHNTFDLKALNKRLSHQQTQHNPAQTGFVFDDVLRQQELSTLQALATEAPLALPHQTQTTKNRDLQAKRALQDDWHKTNAQKLVAQLIAQGPENPGPLNPHTLSIKALSHMRDLSPHYLYRFISYIDTLLWLDKTETRLNSNRSQ